jgi:dethiobiotin synthetase
MKEIVIAGINTEVGKTVVSTLFAKALNAHYWKPVQCGMPSDYDWVKSHIGERCFPSTFSLQTPCSPHLAARNENLWIEANRLKPPKHDGLLIIEGTGGILAPLNEIETWADAAVQWNAEWVLVHRHYLGSLNHCLLTLESLKQRNVPLFGIVFNGDGDAATEQMLLKKAGSRCLGRLIWETELTKSRIEEIAHTWKPALHKALGL